jgi:hypothetical protein
MRSSQDMVLLLFTTINPRNLLKCMVADVSWINFLTSEKTASAKQSRDIASLFMREDEGTLLQFFL